MSRVQVAIFPAILLSILAVIFITRWIARPDIQLTGNSVKQQPAAGRNQENRGTGGQPEVIWEQPQEQPAAAGDGEKPVLDEEQAGGGAPDADMLVGGSTEIPVVDPVFVTPVPGESGAAKVQPLVRSESRGGNDSCSLNNRFADSVLTWCSLIEEYAGQNDLDPALVAALITQESGGDPEAYSHSGAVGLMQIMPRDGLAASFMCIAGPCFSSRPTIEELKDPEYNIAYGTQMLSGLIQKHGSIRDALKSYGPINVGYYYADLVLGIFQRSQ